jgi:hypothetical protein
MMHNQRRHLQATLPIHTTTTTSGKSSTRTPQIQQEQPIRHATLDRPHPLLIPEILHLISQYLNRQQCLVCFYVCKDWHKVFLPRIYSTIEMKGRTHPRNYHPSFKQLQRHAALVQSLILSSEHAQHLRKVERRLEPSSPLFFPNLTKLHLLNRQRSLNSTSDARTADQDLAIISWIRRQGSSFGRLKELYCESLHSEELLDTLMKCHQGLEKLTVEYVTMPTLEHWRFRCHTLWTRFKSLSIHGPSIPYSRPTDPVFQWRNGERGGVQETATSNLEDLVMVKNWSKPKGY